MTNQASTHESDRTLEVEVGLARPDEIGAIWELYQKVWLDAYPNEATGVTEEKLRTCLDADLPWLPKNWQDVLEYPSEKRTVYVARHHGEIVGLVSPKLENGKHRITALYVDPDAQGLGVGTRLLERALVHHGDAEISVCVATYLERLQPFYAKYGFSVVNPEKIIMFDKDPVPHIEMIRPAINR